MKKDSVFGAIIGCKIGDSMGLKYEGINPKRLSKMYSKIEQQNLLFSNGLISDDTEHLLFTAYALYKSQGNSEIFRKLLAKYLKSWFLTLPYGVGFATLKSSIKLLIGISPEKSGVNSAGNGPAMRSGIIGLCFGDDLEKMKNLVKISTIISHKDKKAELGAVVIAYTTYISANHEYINPEEYYEKIKLLLVEYNDTELIQILSEVVNSIKNIENTHEFCKRVFKGKGVSGYMYHTIPAVIHCWLNNQNDFKNAILEMINCGGDTDTTAAILGTIIGAKGNIKNIPAEWKDKVISFPFNDSYIEKLSEALEKSLNKQNISIDKPLDILLFIKNITMYPVILFYGFRRLFPPY